MRRPKYIPRVSIALVSALLTALLADRCVWLWRAKTGLPADAAAVDAALRQRLDRLADFMPRTGDRERTEASDGVTRLHPFTGIEAGFDEGGVLAHFRDPSNQGKFEVLVMGGSVAVHLGDYLVARPPKALREAARAAGRELVLLNFAHGGFKQPQQANRLLYLLSLGARPEAVLELDGFNEVAVAFEIGREFGIHPLYPYGWQSVLPERLATGRERLRVIAGLFSEREGLTELLDRSRERGWLQSAVASRWIEARFNRGLARLQALREERVQLELGREKGGPVPERDGPPFDATPAALIETALGAWEQGSLAMQALCSFHGIRYLHALQPTLHDPGAKPMHERERAIPLPPQAWLEGVRLGYPRLRERGPALRQRGVRLVDATGLFSAEPAERYYDPCHLNGEGIRDLAEHLTGPLVEVCFGTQR